MAASLATIVIICLVLGWVAAKRSAHFAQSMRATKVEAANSAVINELLDTNSNATRFARTAIEATPNPVIIIDQGGYILTSNHAARSRFSIGQARVRFASVVRRPDLIEAIESVFANKKPLTLAIETRVPVDRYERVSIASFQVENVPFVMVTVADETEARMSERMRADFLANASHELRTPLAAIIGFIETLRGPARDDEVARDRFLEVMHKQADRMSRLISDLLSLSRIELNEHVAPTEQTDLAGAVYEAADGLAPLQKKRLVLDAYTDPIWVVGDRDEMAQVVINLIDNALKYSLSDSKVRVSVVGGLAREDAVTASMRQWENAARLPLTSPAFDPGRNYSVVRVENEGEGIERQHLPRLAERFFRIEDTASGKSGTGLGLAIVKHIVSRHRGGLMVESELGRGSAFSVYLPQPLTATTSSLATSEAVT
jgi:two-component system, OmpR family, phosphate regulon sensor histidine kinase PhoR